MTSLNDLKPTKHYRVMDLAQEAGLDVSAWSSYKKGDASPGANPKYCYEWALLQPPNKIVLNLWHDNMQEQNGYIKHQLNLRKEKAGVRRGRARRMEQVILQAYQNVLPLRVIIGSRKEMGVAAVKARLLDPIPWRVEAFDETSGDITLVRGMSVITYVDQYSVSSGTPNKREVHGFVPDRDAGIRRSVLDRAKGRCELCGINGFKTANGGIYLESHHVIPLSENGKDAITNVVALCPNHHREAHHGDAADIKKTLLRVLASF